jgi:glycosyltransferase involved in cell wall biosynthesis
MGTSPALLIVTPSFAPEVGGVETRLDDLCAYLEKNAVPASVVTYQPIITRARGAAVERRGSVVIQRHRWPGGDLFHRLLKYPALEVAYLVPGLLFWSFLHLLRHRKSLRAVHTLGLNSALAIRLLRPFFRFRWVVTTHAIYDFVPGSALARMTRWVLAGADAVLALSNVSRDELVAIGLPRERVETHLTWVNNWTRFVPADRAQARRELGWPDRFTVLFVGRLRAIKGIGLLLAIARRHPEWTFAFAGGGEMLSEVEAAAKASPNIRACGNVINTALAPYYNGADVFVMPSLYSEGFGRVAIEALSCGTPIVCSNKGGIKDHVDDSVAILVEPAEAALEEVLARLAGSPEELARRRAACRAFALEHFGEKNAGQLMAAYFGA